MKRILCVLSITIFLFGLTGCVRVAGTAGYCKTCREGDTAAKRVSFDTADLMPHSLTPGKITV